MEKPINKIAVALWIVAAIWVVGQTWSLFAALRFAHDVQGAYGGNSYFVSDTIWKWVQAIVMVCGQFVAFGVLIELVDQIRWNATLTREEPSRKEANESEE
jgi:exosortase/archaeosortase